MIINRRLIQTLLRRRLLRRGAATNIIFRHVFRHARRPSDKM
jgi:hypothetical protein